MNVQESLEVLYRDDFIIAVNKPAGMIVHRGWCNDSLTVADIVRDSLVQKQVFAIHRIDRGTSGVLLFALDSETASFYQSQMEAQRFRKRYIALVRGPMREAVRVDHPVPKGPKEERVDAITEFSPIATKDRWTLIEAKPITGRYHQIRRHLKHLSHPIVGDVRYGKGDINRHFRETHALKRMALHAIELNIQSKSGLPIDIKAPLPDDLREPLVSLGFSSILEALGFNLA